MSSVPDKYFPSATPPSAPAPDPLTGTTLDRYQLDKLIGEGGMGRVYSAVHTVTRRHCALKLLPEELCKQPDFLSRFQAEAQTLARLNHPNIVQIYSGGESQGRFFLEMEFVDGGDLQKHVVDHVAKTGGGLPEADVYRITGEILAALEYAHREKVIHRDLKPANVLLSRQGGVKVSDFGLARVMGETFSRNRLEKSLLSLTISKVSSMETSPPMPISGSGSFAGTVLYMSPQVLNGDNPDLRDDLFALGVTVYFMLLGRTPVLNYAPIARKRPGLKYNWDQFVATCLAEDRAARFANATAALDFLRQGSRKPRTAVIISCAAAVLILAAGAGYLQSRTREPAAVVKAAQTIEFERIADATGTPAPLALHAHSSSGLPVQFQVVGGPAKINGSMLAITGAGTVTVRATQPGDDRHAAAPPVERAFTVSPAPPAEPKPPEPPPATPIADHKPAVEPVVERPPAEPPVEHRPIEVTVQPKPAERPVDPSERQPPGSAAASSSFVQRKFQSISVEPLRNRKVGGPPFEVFAQSSSKLPVSVFVVGGPATIRGQTVTVKDAGTVTLRFVQGGNNEFLPANPVERSFEVDGAVKAGSSPAAEVADTSISIAPPMVEPAVGRDYFLRFSLYHEKNKYPTTNYARGTLVSINTPVKFVSTSRDDIVLQRLDTREELRVENVEKYSKKSLADIARIMLAEEKTPLEKLPGKLASAIRNGQLIRGMTKEQVLMARGYPPAHETPSLEGDRWVYWSSRFANHPIVFANGRLMEGRGVLVP